MLTLSDTQTMIAAASTPEIARQIGGAYEELKERFFIGDHRPGQVDAGRFSEAVFRFLQHRAGLPVTPLGRRLPGVPALVKSLEGTTGPDPIKLTIPRVLQSVYEFRNRRDAAHLGGDISVNLMDSTYVATACDWVMAELVRLFHGCTAEEAQDIIDNLVERKAPLVWTYGDNRKVVLQAGLPLKNEILLLLYKSAATIDDLADSIPGNDRSQLRARASDLVTERLAVREARGKFAISPLGRRSAEDLIRILRGA